MEHLVRAAAASRRLYREAWGSSPLRVAAAPGRVNLIGEHVDHAGGPVLPLAIDRATGVAVGPGRPGRVRAVSRDLGAVDDRLGDGPGWVRALAATARQCGWDPATGLDVAVASDVPVGGGLSSSAALLVAAGMAFGGPAADDAARADVAARARAIEHECLGVPCGPMDPLASALGRAGRAVRIDGASGAWSHVPLPAGLHLVFVDSGHRHELADGRYAARLAELERARAGLGLGPGLRAWPTFAARPEEQRAAALELLARRDPIAAARARHVASEIGRVGAAIDALAAADLPAFGRLVNAAHDSLRDDFDASSAPIEALRAFVQSHFGPQLLGSRLVGGGWGGGILCVSAEPLAPAALADVKRRSAAATGRSAHAWTIRAADGAAVIA